MVHYLAFINKNVTAGVLLPKRAEGSSKFMKVEKKKKKKEQPKHVVENVEKEVSKPVEENVEKGVSKEVIHQSHAFSKEKRSLLTDLVILLKSHLFTKLKLKILPNPNILPRG